MKKAIFVVGLLAVVLLVSCGGKVSAQPGGSASTESRKGAMDAPQGTMLTGVEKELAEHEVLLWEDDVTETTFDTVAGYISRGKTNLKITGAVTTQDGNEGGYFKPSQITELQNMIHTAVNKKPQLFKIDLSAANLGSSLTFDTVGLGSIILPQGLSDVRIGLYGDGTPFLLEIILPETECGTNKLELNGAFTQVIIPEDAGEVMIRSSNNVAIIVNPYREVIHFPGSGAFGVNTKRWNWRKQNSMSTLVLPHTLANFTGSVHNCEEIYSYAMEPPLAADGGKNQFPNAKTVYVREEVLRAYEEAWFNYTAAEFKPMPQNMEEIEDFIKNWRPAQNNIGRTIEREDN
jgi:hypothetical protein